MSTVTDRAGRSSMRARAEQARYFPLTTVVREAYPEKKNAFASPASPELGPSFERAQAKRVHLKVALLAERARARP